MKKILKRALLGASLLSLLPLSGDAKTFHWSLGFYDERGNSVGSGKFSYDNLTFVDFITSNDIDYESCDWYCDITSYDGLRVNNALDGLSAKINYQDKNYEYNISDSYREMLYFWLGVQLMWSADAGSNWWGRSSEMDFWSERVVPPGAIYRSGNSEVIEITEQKDAWVIPGDIPEGGGYGEGLALNQFEKIEGGLWHGAWGFGELHDFSPWESEKDKQWVQKGTWIAELSGTSVSTVPIPAALPLFLSGLGLIGFSRIRRFK